MKPLSFYVSPVRGILLFALVAILYAGCSKNDPETNQTIGYLSLNVGISVETSDVYNTLKAAEPDEFVVTIYTEAGAEVMNFTRAGDIPASIELPEGNYYVVADSDNNIPAAFDNDYYYGESEVFTISAGASSTVTFTCVLSNIRVTVVYAQSVIDDFGNYSTSVSNAGGSLTFNETEIRAGYFDQGPLSIEAILSYTDGGGSLQTVTLAGSIDNPETGKHYEIHIEASLSDGYGTISFVADETFDTEIVTLGGDESLEMSGELLITEIMYNPAALGDSEGEYIEIHNVSAGTVNLNGLVLRRGSNNNLHVISADLPLLPDDYVVLANGAAATDNVSYVYSGISLVNGGDELIINTYGTDGTDGAVICRVDYGATGFNTSLNGASLQLDPTISDVNEAQLGTNWCASSVAYNTGDLGTPGVVNSNCD